MTEPTGPYVIPIETLVELIPPTYWEGAQGKVDVRDGKVERMYLTVEEAVRVCWTAFTVVSGGRRLHPEKDRKALIAIALLHELAVAFGYTEPIPLDEEAGQ